MGRSKHSGKGALNIRGEESVQSRARRKKRKQSTAEGLVEGIRETPTRRMPTKGTEIAKKVRKFFTGK